MYAGLQVFYCFDAFCQLVFEVGEGLFAQGCACFGGVALPGHGVCDVQFFGLEQCLGFGGPFGCELFLAFAAFDFVEFFAQGAGCAFVAGAEFFIDFLHGCGIRFGSEPRTHAGGAFARGGSAEDAACGLV